LIYTVRGSRPVAQAVEGVRVSITDDARPEARPQASPSGGGGGGFSGGGGGGGFSGGGGGFDKTPPQDIAAEQGVLGGMLLSKDAIADVVEILKSHDFYRPVHSTVFDVILELYGRGEPADGVTVAAALADAGDLQRIGGVPYLHTLIESVPTAANASYYARIVSERAVLRRLVEAGTKIVQLGYGTGGNGGRDVDDIVDLAQQAVYDVTERRVNEDFAILADMLQPTLDEIEAVGATNGMMTGVPTGFSDLDRLLNGLHPGQLIIVAGRPGLGKALALDTPVPTPGGWTTMGALEAGDAVLGADGRPTTVVRAFDVLHGRPCYEVTFSDGSTIVADEEHLWKTTTRASRRQHSEVTGAQQWPADDRVAARPDGHSRVVTTAEIAATLRHPADDRANHAVNNCGPLELAESHELPIPPYTLGAWLGDGHSAVARFTMADPEMVLFIEADGFLVSPSGCHSRSGSFVDHLRHAGVLGTKHIPPAYLRSSSTQRRALLAGLLDPDGTVGAGGVVQFCSTSKQLADDVYELIVSLGYRCGISTKAAESSTAFVVTFPAEDEVFRLERKRLAHKECLRATTDARSRTRYVTAIAPVPSVPVRCITVDNEDHMYLAGRSMIPTHNSTASMDIARNAAIRANCASAIFSLEMSKIEIVMRLLSAEARVPLHILRSGQLSDDDWTKLARRMGEISEAPIFVDDTPSMNLMEIRAKSRRLKQRHNLKLIVIDYLQLMSSPKKTESRQQEVAELSRGLKLLAKEVECPVIAVSQLNRGPEQRTDKRPQLSDLRESGCMPASTRLQRADNGGEITLGELVLSQIQPAVLAVDDRHRLVSSRLLKTFPTGIKPVFRLKLASGREVDATANHRFLTIDGWIRLDELAPGVAVAVPRRLPEPEQASSWDEDRLVLLAHLLGDGSIGPNSVKYATADPANKDAVELAAKSAFDIAVTGKVVGRTWQLSLPSPTRLTHNKFHPVRDWLQPLGLWGSRSGNKFIPEAIFGLPDSSLALFLHHLWATDGSITIGRNGRGPIVRTYYASTSRRLAENVQRALLRFQVRSRLMATTKYGYGKCWNVVIQGSEDQARFMRSVGCHGERGDRIPEALEILDALRPNPNVDLVPWSVSTRVKAAMTASGIPHRELADRLGERYSGSYMLGSEGRQRRFSRGRLARIAEIVNSVELADLAGSDIYWDEVSSIEPLGEMPTFDATVDETHNFIANGIVAHNSIEQDADVVILLHRDDYYDKESPRAGEADFIVAKHRNGPTDTVTVAAQLHLSRFVDMAI
jgi:replicative DNA helicase